MSERATAAGAVVSIRDLTIAFSKRPRPVVEGVGFDVRRGEIMGLIGESGSGKTLTALSILGLLPHGARVLSGTITLGDRNLLALSQRELSRVRGDRIAMIFQDPMTAMNPVLRIGDQVAEPLVTHRGQGWRAARASAVQLLRRVQIPAAEERAAGYPYQYSGGMLQRATIAMGLACQPELIIADEPTTALDVTIQAQILKLLIHIRDTQNAAILLITHDLGVVAEVCDRMAVMYAGRVMEQGPVSEVFAKPAHPYTETLLRSTPRVDAEFDLAAVPVMPPHRAAPGHACRFVDRCPYRFERCDAEPPLIETAPDRAARCWLVEGSH
ncbi:MAG: peptide ABC transporter ATP-binding protein [Candidatus Nephthysia bennettiae]|uniref:ABC transporter ATP-binding protein n=1 Tax=Candidatus Nephthysia bennettiae TaxID=3127016 RepID=A0A934K901_9BACT|nr:ABC transporter ATP-binding protein [Candidatus Dormibacteraeota bacterium]PZR85887.1 MAG: peptide ABC transporter ATP-binding protein [Candidatus Dormibacteraeota bacterium]